MVPEVRIRPQSTSAAGLLVALASVAATAAPGFGQQVEGEPGPTAEVACAPSAAGAQAAGPRYEGPHGLWIGMDGEGDRLQVRWRTRARTPGILRWLRDGRIRGERRTPAGRSHRAELRYRGAGTLTLEYGSATDGEDLHRTTLRFGESGRGPVELPPVDSLYVVGDVHGEYGRLRALLRNAGLVDAAGRWRGGRRHLVLLGDLMDRGPDVTRLLWYVYELEAEARAAGGAVHVVLGNHEVMVFTGDHRYVAPKERLLAHLHGLDYGRMYDPRSSLIGRWLGSKPAAIRIGSVLLAHGGIGRGYLDYDLEAIDDSLATFLGEPLFRRWSDSTVAVPPMDSAAVGRRVDFFFGDESPFWYRGYAWSGEESRDAAGGAPGEGGSTPADAGSELADVLDRYGSRVHVVAHTPVETIGTRFGGRVILVDLVEPASELLLLIREDGETRSARVPLEGPPEPLDPPAPISGSRDALHPPASISGDPEAPPGG